MVGISSVGGSGTQGPAIVWFHHPSKLDLQDALLHKPQKRKHMEEKAGKGFVGSPGSDHAAHFCSHSFGQNSVTGLPRTARGMYLVE